MAAAAFAKVLGRRYSIRLVESEEIGTVGVGESTVPHLKLFNQVLGIDEIDFVKSVQGTFKLGIQFVEWGRLGDRYFHGFGPIGHERGVLAFHQYWIKLFNQGKVTDLAPYSLHSAAAPQGKFMVSATDVPAHSPLASIGYAYQFDAGLYAAYLRRFAEAHGVRRTEGKVVDVALRGEDGFIDHVRLESGEKLGADLFVDCSGFRGLLIEQALHTGYENWTHWLPCDRAWAVPSENVGDPPPFTRSTARTAGWQWRIPLQHRTGNGYVFSSKFISEQQAADTLLSNLEGRPLAEPKLLRFTTGMRRKIWNRNCVAVGLSSGFLEPLEATSIYLIQSCVARLVNLLPDREFSPVLIDRYNAQQRFEFERIRDFLVLHYHATERTDSPLWNECRTMSIPDPLADNIRLFRDSGRFFRDAEEMFALPSWVQVMIGQRIVPRSYHPVVDELPDAELVAFVDGVRKVIATCVAAMPTHAQFIARFCQASKQAP
ncbi:MAG: tryptophan halogenase family protein [Gammaproteobacteria bacterium]